MRTILNQNWHVRKPAVRGRKGLVASQHLAAAEIGAEVLRAGGNAVDAAVATSFAVSVIEPWMSGIGGGSYMQIGLADEAKVRTVSFGMRAPQGLDPRDYPLAEGAGEVGDLFTWPAVVEDRNITGYHSIAVPGHVAGMGLAWERYGSMPWAELLAPAIELAEGGLPVTWFATLRIAGAAKDLRKFPESTAIYLPDGLPPAPEQGKPMPIRPMGKLADTLRRLAEAGHRDLYEGDLAAAIVADLEAGGSRITRDDLRHYRAEETDPLTRAYGDVTVNAAPGLTAGPTLLRVLETIDGKIGKGVPGAAAYATWAKALEVAYEERFATMGDVEDARDPASTTHFTVVDGDGNMVSLTQTLLSAFGSKVVLPRTGILMNNGIMWFDPRPGGPNALGPGKRPLSNMCPVMLCREGRPWVALGASGGRRIMPAVMQIVSMLVDCGMGLEDAFHQPRIDVSGDHKANVDRRLGSDVFAALEERMPVMPLEDTVYPSMFACPNAVMQDADGGQQGMAYVMYPVSGVAAA